jgi:hypothetical protein
MAPADQRAQGLLPAIRSHITPFPSGLDVPGDAGSNSEPLQFTQASQCALILR